MELSTRICVLMWIVGVVLVLSSHTVQGRIRHCFSCRSRGELGDCKDPFAYNASDVTTIRGVEATPCASGWCAKILEGGRNDDFDGATERLCIQRPPTDGQERCTNTIIDRKKVYMCFCLGDLCNQGAPLASSFVLPVFLMFVALGLHRWNIN